MRGLLVVLLLAGSAAAQRSDTIYQQLIKDATGVTVSPNVRNVGQWSHLFRIERVQKPAAGACTDNALSVYFEASFNGTDYFLVGTYVSSTTDQGQVGGLASRSTNQYLSGPIPNLRVRLSGDFANCTYNVYYSGYLGSQDVPTIPGRALGFKTSSVLMSNASNQIVPEISTGFAIGIYSLAITNPLGSGVSAETFILTSTYYPQQPVYWIAGQIAPGTSYVLPMSFGVPYFTITEVSTDLAVRTVSGATCPLCAVNVVYRYE